MSILDLMINDHSRIVRLLNVVEENTQNLRSLKESFNTFEWTFEKHIFTEEKAIFTQYDPEDVAQGYEMVPELMKEHSILLKLLKKIKKSIKKQRTNDIQEFKEKLMEHKNFEEEHVYPKLDQELDESEKKVIIERINEIL